MNTLHHVLPAKRLLIMVAFFLVACTPASEVKQLLVGSWLSQTDFGEICATYYPDGRFEFFSKKILGKKPQIDEKIAQIYGLNEEQTDPNSPQLKYSAGWWIPLNGGRVFQAYEIVRKANGEEIATENRIAQKQYYVVNFSDKANKHTLINIKESEHRFDNTRVDNCSTFKEKVDMNFNTPQSWNVSMSPTYWRDETQSN